MNFDTIDLSFRISYPLLIIFIVLAILYTIFIYRYTIPATSRLIKSLLVVIRVLTISFLILLIFEPSISIKFNERIDPVNLVFVDNSQSIVIRDSVERKNDIEIFLNNFSNNVEGENAYYSFNSSIDSIFISPDDSLSFDGNSTNVEQLVPFIKNSEKNIASATIISDGIINEGSNSASIFDRLNIPIFTVAIGDTTIRTDLGIKKVQYNDLIYKNSQNEIKVVVLNQFLSGKNVSIELYEDSKKIDQKNLQLDLSGINIIPFNYSPKESGEKHLRISVQKLKNEETHDNNSYSFIVNVLEDKIKVLCVCGAPSPDYSVIKQILSKNDKTDFNEIVQMTESKFIDDGNWKSKTDSADIFILIDFPSKYSPQRLLDNIDDAINKKQKSYFLILSQSVDQKRLNSLIHNLPYKINSYSSEIHEVYPVISNTIDPIISGNRNFWNSMPPIFQLESDISPRAGSKILINSNLNKGQDGSPILFSYSLNKTNAIIFNGFNFWRWKLQRDEENSTIVERFFNNSIKWLYSYRQKEKMFVYPTKKVFRTNEGIDFKASIYDETLSPRNDAMVTVAAGNESGNYELQLQSTGNGSYEGKFNITNSGEYSYKSKIILDNRTFVGKPGKFYISEINIEKINYVLNENYLKLISNNTSGKSFVISNYADLFHELNLNNQKRVLLNSDTIEYNFLENEWIMVLILFLFSGEWFIRKNKGLL